MRGSGPEDGRAWGQYRFGRWKQWARIVPARRRGNEVALLVRRVLSQRRKRSERAAGRLARGRQLEHCSRLARIGIDAQEQKLRRDRAEIDCSVDQRFDLFGLSADLSADLRALARDRSGSRFEHDVEGLDDFTFDR